MHSQKKSLRKTVNYELIVGYSMIIIGTVGLAWVIGLI
jgi:hypothetical protein